MPKNKITDEELLELEELEKKVIGEERGLLKFVEKDSDLSVDGTSTEKRKPVWVDEDDSTTKIPSKLGKYATVETPDTYENLLRRKFQQTVGVPNWCKKNTICDESLETDDSNELMRCGKILDTRNVLKKGVLKIDKMEDLNKETKIEGPIINAVEFHPTSTLALVAGQSGIVSLIQVDGITNNKLQSIKFRGFCVECAHFTTDGEQFIIGNRKARHFWYYDMMEGRSIQISIHHSLGPMNMSNFSMSPDGKFIAVCGKYGNIHLLTSRTKEWIGDLKMNSDVVDVSFSSDGSRMYSYSDDGEVYEWDMSSRRCIKKFSDDGCLKGTSMTLSHNDRILATGSDSGIVNLFEMPIKNSQMTPVKMIKNLVTPVTAMAFNSSSEILAIASEKKHNAIKMVHFPSMTVFSNFPGFQEVGLPRVLSFSPSSGFFAVGNAQRSVLLYRLKHYKNY